MHQEQRPNRRKAILISSGSVLIFIVINVLSMYVTAITHKSLFGWLGFIASTILLYWGIAKSQRIMREQEQANR